MMAIESAPCVLFVHGAGDGAYKEDAKLVSSLAQNLRADFEIRYPRMPTEASPRPAAWKRRVVKEIATMGYDAILVGHSAGGTMLTRLLAKPDPDRWIAGLFLISAPFCGEGGWHIDGFDLPNDLERRLQPGLRVFLYHGSNDEVVPSAHLDLYEKALPGAVVRRLEGRNHQLNDDLSEVARDIKRLDQHIKLHPEVRRRRG